MVPPRFYRSFAEFEREMIRPGYRVGQTVEDILDDPGAFEREFDFDKEVDDDDDDE
jgi:hypothetical protein